MKINLITFLFFIFSIGLINGCKKELSNDEILTNIIKINNLLALEVREPDIGPKFILGKFLFHDPILSGNRDVACVSCHLPEYKTTDGLKNSIGTNGIGRGSDRYLKNNINHQIRNSPDLYNRDHGHVKNLFWDGGVEFTNKPIRKYITPMGMNLKKGFENTLAVQAIFPITRFDEMLGNYEDISLNSLPLIHRNKKNELATNQDNKKYHEKIQFSLNKLMKRLLGSDNINFWQKEYRKLFNEAYPNIKIENLNETHIANALSRYQELAFANYNSPWDNYLNGNLKSLSQNQKKGAILFFGKGNCSSCHSGPLFSDFNFYSIGVPSNIKIEGHYKTDYGRYNITRKNIDKFKFRTPPLRMVEYTSPYFHNGYETNLEKVIDQHVNPYQYGSKYNKDGSHTMSRIELDNIDLKSDTIILEKKEYKYLVSFLTSLSGYASIDEKLIIPNYVPSGLNQWLKNY